MPELGPYGSVRGARGNSRPYRERFGIGRVSAHSHIPDSSRIVGGAGGSPECRYHVGPQADQFRRDGRHAIQNAVSPTILDRYILAFNVALLL
jgi:hypothetical protein